MKISDETSPVVRSRVLMIVTLRSRLIVMLRSLETETVTDPIFVLVIHHVHSAFFRYVVSFWSLSLKLLRSRTIRCVRMRIQKLRANQKTYLAPWTLE